MNTLMEREAPAPLKKLSPTATLVLGLGVLEDIVRAHELPFLSSPKILEYKFSLDGLIEDIASGVKNSNDLSLVVAWVTGESWKETYKVTSLLDTDNLADRQYHGVTHVMTNLQTGQREFDLVILQELLAYLKNPNKEMG